MTILGYIALSALFMFIIQCITNNKPQAFWEIVWGVYAFILAIILAMFIYALMDVLPEPH